MKTKHYINSGWKFCLKSDDAGLEKIIRRGVWFDASVPGTIHTDLLRHQMIADPFYADNEKSLQWIGEKDWIYKTEFDLPKNFDPAKSAELLFGGLDTISEVFLNGVKLGNTSNMFRSYVFDTTGSLLSQGNVLEVHLSSAAEYARHVEKMHGRLPVALNSSRVYIRKAQYSFGWDWGPTFVTSGIWKPVCLCQGEKAEIDYFNVTTTEITGNAASVALGVFVKNPSEEDLILEVSLSDSSSAVTRRTELSGNGLINISMKVENPVLWYPNGMGTPHLYDLKVKLSDRSKKMLDEKQTKTGIRTINLRRAKSDMDQNTAGISKTDGPDTASDFSFIVNGEPLFIKGANWIPADSFLSRVSEEKYRELIGYARDAHMNMLRVWGGGIYEDDIFYSICDEMGILVWQDFMFACASYPEIPEFLENVKYEVQENIRRLQPHPSIAVWCGNNENEWIWYQEQRSSYKNMPGFVIYHELIPEILSKLDPSRPYLPSTPFGDDEDPNSETSGNRHQWDVWSRWIDYKQVRSDRSLFVTEFGFQAPANYSTLKSVIAKKDRHVQSEVFEFHNRQTEGNERLFRFLSGHLPVVTDIKDFIYLTQLNQGFAMRECLEHWRLRSERTNGAVIWQLNDCWPVASWSLVDSGSMPKPAWYFASSAFAPLVIDISRNGNKFDLSIMNDTANVFSGRYEITAVYLPKAKTELLDSDIVRLIPHEHRVIPDVLTFEYPDLKNLVLIATLYDGKNGRISRNYYTHDEWKYMQLPDPGIGFKLKDNDNGGTRHGELKAVCSKPAFFVTFYRNHTVFTENCLIMLPGEEHVLGIRNLGNEAASSKLGIFTLNDYLHK